MTNYEDMRKGDLLAEPERLLAARKERKMGDYKVVPVEPTTAMREVWKRMRGYCWYDKYKAMLDAVPAVQGEPVGWQFYQHGEWWDGDDRIKDHRKNTEEAGFRVRDVYAAPHPAPDELSDYDRGFRDGKLDRLIDEVVAESGLVEALADAVEYLDNNRLNEIGSGSALHRAMTAALAAYRKGGEA